MSLVLVADDDDDIRHLIGMKLRRAGHGVEFAVDGSGALESARHTRPDLIVLDVMMPGMSGLDVANELARDLDLQHIPVLFLTALASSRDLSEALGAGVAAYVRKPFSPANLLGRIEEILRATTLGA